jgi:hypothetical protein
VAVLVAVVSLRPGPEKLAAEPLPVAEAEASEGAAEDREAVLAA